MWGTAQKFDIPSFAWLVCYSGWFGGSLAEDSPFV